MTDDLAVLGAAGFESLFDGPARDTLEASVLPAFLCRQRWFGSKARAIARAAVVDGGPLEPPHTPYLAIIRVTYEDGGGDDYAVPLAIATGERAVHLREARPQAAVAWLDRVGGRLLVDAMADDDACRGVLETLAARPEAARVEYPLERGTVVTTRDRTPLVDDPRDASRVRRTGAEQSNSSIIFGTLGILKLYRRLERGPHPELELGRFLRRHGFDDVPAVLASMEYETEPGRSALAVLHQLVPDARDGWEHALEHVGLYYARLALQRAPAEPAREKRTAPPAVSAAAASDRDHAAVGPYLAAARTLGEQTGRLHLTLASADTPDLAPEPLTSDDITRVVDSARDRAARALAQLAAARAALTPTAGPRADALLGRQRALADALDTFASTRIDATRTRCHQDYHLGQLLWTGSRYALLDFEGEPLRPLAERRAKRSPLTDVAGMLRSYSYAAWSGLFAWSKAHAQEPLAREPWATRWEAAVAGSFLAAYREVTAGASFVPADPVAYERLLRLLMLDKALYELEYELNNRPDWILVPVEGLLRLIA